MGRLGKLLETLYAAPRTDRAVHIRARQFMDHAVVVRANEKRSRDQEAAGGSRSVMLTATREGGDEPADADIHELWWAGPGRWRVDHAGSVRIADGGELIFWSSAAGMLRRPDRARFPEGFGMIEPRTVAAIFDVVRVGTARVSGRSCFDVTLRPASANAPGDMRRAAPVWLGDEARCQFDRATGLVVGVDARFEGEPCSSWTSLLFETPPAIDPAVLDFTAPAGSQARNPVELHAEHLRRIGVDLSGVGERDPDALQEAFRRHHAPPAPEARAQQHIPHGDPPADRAASEAQIRHAFEHVVTPSEDGEAVPTVEGGANLGPSLRAAGSRAPGGANTPATVRVEHLKFLGPDEAVVWYSLERGGSILLAGLEGRAQRRGARWLVSRPTFCAIVGSIGVRCPPPPDTV